MDDIHKQRLEALKRCTFVPGSNPKRFCRDTPLDNTLTERQCAYIDILAWRFRRQMPAALVPSAKPADLPPKPKAPPRVPPCHECGAQHGPEIEHPPAQGRLI